MRKVFLEKIFYDFLMISFCFFQFLSLQTFFSSLIVHTPVTRFKILTFKLKTQGDPEAAACQLTRPTRHVLGEKSTSIWPIAKALGERPSDQDGHWLHA